MTHFVVRSAAVVLVLMTARDLPEAAGAAASPAVVAIELNGNHVVVPVECQGRRLSFVLDTGAGSSFIDLGRARALGLAVGSSFRAGGVGPGSTAGAVLTRPVAAKVIAGDSSVDASIGAALDMAAIAAHAGRDIDGILGADFIRRFVLEIDYEHERLRLHDPLAFSYQGLGSTVPLTFRNQFPIVRASLQLPGDVSIDVDAILDVGSSLAVAVTQPVAERYQLAERLQATPPLAVGRGAGGATQSRLARLPAIAIGDIRVPNPVTSLAQAGSGVLSSSTISDVNIGGGVMRHFTMFFDYSRSRVTFEPNTAFNEPFEFDMSGLSLTTDDAAHERVIVETVRPGSPAAAAGFEPGDRMLSLDDQAASAVKMEGLRRAFRIDDHLYRIVVERSGREITAVLKTRRLI
jgi:predicted aspartyl protease